jgi:glucuronokinase
MSISLSAPARINILGNPADGNEGDFATISAAVDLRAYCTIQSADEFILHLQAMPSVKFSRTSSSLSLNGSHDLLIAAVNRLISFSPEFKSKSSELGFEFTIKSEVPRQSGLGGSSLFIILTLAALREHYHLDPQTHNNYVLAELTQRVEARDLGITAGYADRYVPLFGGLAYIDYRGKLSQKDIFSEPLATYERLDQAIPNLNFVAITTGIQHDSGDVHGRMRPRYLEEYSAWQNSGGQMPPMVSFMSSAWECAWQGKIALLNGELDTFGALMNRNHKLTDEMMRYCGFDNGAGQINNLLIEKANNTIALGAKLTGAGNGGSVFALVKPGDAEKLIDIWQDTAKLNKLDKARIFKVRISSVGLRLENK